MPTDEFDDFEYVKVIHLGGNRVSAVAKFHSDPAELPMNIKEARNFFAGLAFRLSAIIKRDRKGANEK